MLTRRRFLATAACTMAAAGLHAQGQSKVRVGLSIPKDATGPHMPIDFVGLSYEVQQLADPSFFSAQNRGLIREFKALSASGVLRLGGNTSEFAYWKPTPDSPEPEHPQVREVTGEPQARYYAVTVEAVRNLAEFLQATGWTCVYGIGMGTNTPARAAEEAVFAAEKLGDRLQYFQIGNEADLFDRHLRDPKTWSAKTYLQEWLSLSRAIAAGVPAAKFGTPDVASKVSWLTEIADQWPSIQAPPHVTTLTHHYYFGGPATNPEVNIPNLLKPATMQKVQNTANIASAAASKIGARVGMTEGNTCYRGGKPGVSDVFAAALWSADYSLLLASNDYSGVNLHGGTGKSVANSVGGSLPGDALLAAKGETPEQIAAHPHPFYTPIATFGSDYVLEPVAYGLKFAGSFSGGTLLKTEFSTKLQDAGVNATAYAAKLPSGQASVIILNKDAAADLEVELDFGAGASGRVQTETLHAPGIDSREAHITTSTKTDSLKQGKCSVTVPHATGLRLTVV
ncbi:MAG TPA: hypothetical protein VMU26_30940 [Candidatus Polarisedimenticolia bacterium]|nr:hypothetical protein [Candidatus Polarisedimenticolia bacterium]